MRHHHDRLPLLLVESLQKLEDLVTRNKAGKAILRVPAGGTAAVSAGVEAAVAALASDDDTPSPNDGNAALDEWRRLG